jgi:phosphate transport system permease protein
MTAQLDAPERDPGLPDPSAPLIASGNLRRRDAVSRAVTASATVAAFLAVAVLAILVFTVISKAWSVLSLSFIFTNPSGLDSGGIANALLGTIEIVAIAAVIALPVGILTGLYLTELAGANSRSARFLKLVLDLLQGLPTIIVGVVVYGLIVAVTHRQSGFAASVGLSIVMLPLIARSSQEVLLLVPGTLREAADSLGVSRWRTVLGVILPTAAGGIATGAILSIARAAGETAPLLVLDSIYDPNATQLNPFGHGVPNVPILILTTSDLPSPSALTRAWGAAFVLLAAILIANVAARIMLARSRRKMMG